MLVFMDYLLVKKLIRLIRNLGAKWSRPIEVILAQMQGKWLRAL